MTKNELYFLTKKLIEYADEKIVVLGEEAKSDVKKIEYIINDLQSFYKGV